jgi:hypothetical protein
MISDKICYDKMNFGYCTKGGDCPVCNTEIGLTNNLQELNINAKQYVPKSKQIVTDKPLDLNLSAKEFVPKSREQQDDLVDDDAEEEFDMIMRDILENEVVEECESESDDERWYPNYKNCECCKGFVHKCKGIACENLGVCYCKMKEECDDEEDVE